MKYNLKTLSNFGLTLIFIFSLLLNPVLAQISETPAEIPVSDAPYFYLETNFIDLGADKNNGSYKIFAHSSVKWQTTSSAVDQKILTLSKTSGQGPAEISFSVDKSKLTTGWHDLPVNYNWQATYQSTEITGSDSLTIRAYIEAIYPSTETAPHQEQATSPREETIPYIESQISSEPMLPREKVGETPYLPTEKEISSPEEKQVLIQESQPEMPTPESQKETPKNFITKLIETIIIFFKRILIVNRLVEGEECWIRKNPRLTSFIIEKAPKGTLLIILEAKRPWYKVLNPKTRTVGWIHDSQFIMLKYKRTPTPPSIQRLRGSCEPEAFTARKA